MHLKSPVMVVGLSWAVQHVTCCSPCCHSSALRMCYCRTTAKRRLADGVPPVGAAHSRDCCFLVQREVGVDGKYTCAFAANGSMFGSGWVCVATCLRCVAC
jgi:hypothetical protein